MEKRARAREICMQLEAFEILCARYKSDLWLAGFQALRSGNEISNRNLNHREREPHTSELERQQSIAAA